MGETSSLKSNSFMDIFYEAPLSEETVQLFEKARIISINVYKKSKQLEVLLASEKFIPAEAVSEFEEYLIDLFNYKHISVKVKFETTLPLGKILEKHWESIVFTLNKKVAVSRGLFSDCKWELYGKKLIIKLKNGGSEILKSHQCDRLIEEIIEDSFSYRLKVQFADLAIDEDLKEEYLEFKENEEAKAIENLEILENELKQEKESGIGKISNDIPVNGGTRIILGKNFNEDILKMNEVTQDSGRVAIFGDILRVDFREIRGDRYIGIFDITDYTGSLTIKFFIKKDRTSSIKEYLREKITVKVRGEVQYDKFAKEFVIMASDIIELERQVKMDTAKEKRVELHLHSQMSALDAVTPIKDLVNRAAEWGHKAIAITDHGVVQAYPDAYKAAKKNNIKIIYGIECYMVDDSSPIVYNPNGCPINGDFIALDIETTGLDPEKDRITEIGAVKFRNGEIIDTFGTLVNPEMYIPDHIVKLTGITDDMIKNSPVIDSVMPKFMDFLGDMPIVAHNAGFDMSFIKYNAARMGLKLTNPVIDTLQLSRKMFPRLGKHKLNTVAKHLQIAQECHHRAVNDSITAAKIFIRCLEILKDKGIKTIDDLESTFAGCENFKNLHTYHCAILAKNQTGLKNLYKIVTHSHIKYFYKKPRVPKKLLMKYRQGLIVGSACEAGELYSAILNRKSEEEILKIAEFYDYFEIQPLGNNRFLINSGKVSGYEELKDINRKIIRLGEKTKKPVVATCDVHFMDPKDEVFRRILMAGQGYEDADNQAPLYFRTTDEMLEEFSYLGSDKAYEVVVKNTNAIADMIEVITPIPEGTFPPKLEGAEEEIKRLAETRAKEIYGEPLPKIVEKRLNRELDSIIRNGFAVMYIIAQKLTFKSLEDGYLVGSRGSVGSSFVANVAGITEVNSLKPHYICGNCKYSEFILDGSVDCGFDLPDKECPECGNLLKKDGYDIPFETFLGFEGDKEPDIDLNFSGEYQSRAHKYAEELFGKGHVFRAGTIATVAEKTAYGFVKNYLDERNIVATNAEINRLLRGCTGVKRTTGQHPGGIMIIPQDKEIYDFSPIQYPADDTESDIITTHFDYHFLHGSILKLDILGHDDPTVIKMLEDLTGVDARTIPLGEKRTMGIFSSTEPLGVRPEDINSEVGTFAIPEFGTKFVRQMLVDTKPTKFSELIRISGLSHGTDVWLNNAQDLIKNNIASLSQTICCRDDIMIYLMHAGLPPKTAFKIMEDVRRGKGLTEEYEKIMRENNVPDWYIQSCKKIKYMFPKAHAAAYVMMAFRIAWFKVYYPEAFYATYFTVKAGDFDAELMCCGQEKVKNKIKELENKGNCLTQKEKNVLTILEVVNEMYARGIKFLPVDLYKSDAAKFEITPEGIRPPLNTLQGLGATAAQSIVDARKNGKFLSKDELRFRTRISKSVMEILQKHGCLDGMPESNQISFLKA